MQIHQLIKDTIKNHKNKIELTQWAIISGVSSLVYSEYLMNMKRRSVPTNVLIVPSIKTVNELLNPDNQFMELLSEKLIDSIASNNTFYKFADAPELILFNKDNIEIMKTIFDLYIIPNISKRLPETIAKKFGLDNPDQNQFAIQSNELDLFGRNPISDEQFNFIVEETVLQLLTLLPTMKKDIELPEVNRDIYMTDEEILTIGNEKAICPIHFNKAIFNNKEVLKVISFVTDTTITEMDLNKTAMAKNDEIVTYKIDTGIFNQVSITTLKGIQTGEESKDNVDG